MTGEQKLTPKFALSRVSGMSLLALVAILTCTASAVKKETMQVKNGLAEVRTVIV
jgi:hypothetical protein